MYRRLLKALHGIGAIGVMGSLGACIVLVATALSVANIVLAVWRPRFHRTALP